MKRLRLTQFNSGSYQKNKKIVQEKNLSVEDCASKFKSVEDQFAKAAIKIMDSGKPSAKFMDFIAGADDPH
jgi:hypothetical protein